MTSTYRVIAQGLSGERAPDDTARRLAALFKCDADKAQRLLAPQGAVVKSGLTRDDAERYREALAACGCRVRVVEMAPAGAEPGPDTFDRWKDLAEQGDAQAQYYVGQMYRDGEGTAPDVAAAAEWFRKSAEQGNAMAQYNLGAMYTDGSFPPDALAAYRWLRIAGSSGQPEASLGLQALEPVIPLRDKVLARIVARDWIRRFSGKAGAGDAPAVTEAQVRSILPMLERPGMQAADRDPPVVHQVAADLASTFTIDDGSGRGTPLVIRHSMLERLCMDAAELYALAMQNRREQQQGTSGAITGASDPARVTLSEQRLRKLQPELLDATRWQQEDERQAHLASIRAHLEGGDSRAAVVVDAEKAVVAAYTDELDCIALLQFDPALARANEWRVGTRLLAVNVYPLRGMDLARDLLPGPKDTRQFKNFIPFIAELLTDDCERVETRKREIGEDEWLRTMALGKQAYVDKGIPPRDGRPLQCAEPARPRRAAPPPPKEEEPALPALSRLGAGAGIGIGDFFKVFGGFVFCLLMVMAGFARVGSMAPGTLHSVVCFGMGMFALAGLALLFVLYRWIRPD